MRNFNDPESMAEEQLKAFLDSLPIERRAQLEAEPFIGIMESTTEQS